MTNASRSPSSIADAAGDPRRVFVVAGMHRAGTSVVARGLQALGIDLGDRLMSANVQFNARGFFEDTDIVRIDDALFEAVGADWKNIALLDDVDWGAAEHASMRVEARQLLEVRLQRSGQFGFKDPRLPRLLPFWQRVFAGVGAADAYVIAVRHPLAVIDSLTARDELDVRRSAWLWLIHVICALHHTTGRPRVVVDYDRLLAAPESELARVARGLRVSAPLMEAEAGKAYVDFLSDELRHAQYAADDQLPASLPPLLIATHALAQRLARDDPSLESAEARGEVRNLYAQVSALSPLLAYAGVVEREADTVPRLRGELDWARDSLARATEFSKSLGTTLEQKEAARREAERHAESLDAALQQKEDARREAERHAESLVAALQQKEDTRRDAERHAESLDAARRDSERHAQSLEATLQQKEDALTTAHVYNDDLQATLRSKDAALATAQTYNDDLQATLRRKESELVTAHATLERIAERLVGRMLLRQIDRARDGG